MPLCVAPIIHHIDTDSIYYVHLSESSNSTSINPKLIGLNYLIWSRLMQKAFGK